MIELQSAKGALFGPETFTIEGGAMVKVAAPSSGASREFVDMVMGVSKPEEGKALLFGEDIYGVTEEEYVSLMGRVGLVSEKLMVSNLLNWENVALPYVYHRRGDMDRLEELTEKVFGAFGVSIEEGERVMAAPPGNLRLDLDKILKMIRAFATEPELVIYEEIAGGAAPDFVEAAIGLAVEFHRGAKGRTSLFVTRDIDSLKALPTGRVITLEKGVAAKSNGN